MSSKDLAVSVRNVSKSYVISHQADRPETLKEAIRQRLSKPLNTSTKETFWALNDVSFDVQKGDVLGIIGKNGAGKSTLLKILSRITEPTSGQIDLYGRIGSLLEVGTGFHPELTGRENIYLNGAILGMRRREIARQFDEIVDFAEVSQFLDTPVKRYSSGMYIRLAFAVAAHLDTEILIVDEVLAVGDSEFQKKCLGKMHDVSLGGRTVLFVSHNMAVIRSLCQKCCLLRKGAVAFIGGVDEAANRYLQSDEANELRPYIEPVRPKDASPYIAHAELLVNGVRSSDVHLGDELTVEMEFAAEQPIRHVRIGYNVSNFQGASILDANNRYQSSNGFSAAVTRGKIRIRLGMVPLMPDRYVIRINLGDQQHDSHIVEDALTFEVFDKDIWGKGHVPPERASHLWWPTDFHFSEITTEAVGAIGSGGL